MYIYLKQGKEFTFSATNETFRIKHSMNCTSTNLIYVITCAGCGHNYIGETGDVLRNRVTVHKQQIRDLHTRMLGVSKHIDECAAGLTPQFTVFPFYKILSPSEGMIDCEQSLFLSSVSHAHERVSSGEAARCEKRGRQPEKKKETARTARANRDFKIPYGGLLLWLLRPWGTRLTTPFPLQTSNRLRFRCTATGCSVSSTCLYKNGYVRLYSTFIQQRLDQWQWFPSLVLIWHLPEVRFASQLLLEPQNK